MTYPRLVALSLVGASALLACSASNDKGSGAGASTTVSSSSAGSGGGATSSSISSSSTGAAGGGAGGGVVIAVDGGPDAGACTQLNIGILGNPGADPSANFEQWLVMSGTSVVRIQTTADAGTPVTAATLQPFDVVILDWLTRDYTSAEAAAFSAWVTAGGGVVSMSGFSSSAANDWHANSLLAPLAVTYSGPPIDGPVTSFAPHPITTGLTSVTFNGGFAISDLGGTASTRTPIAFLSTGSGTVDVAYAIQMGAGRAFVWGDEWIEFDSEWSTLPEIKQLWVQVFSWIAPTNKCPLQPK